MTRSTLGRSMKGLCRTTLLALGLTALTAHAAGEIGGHIAGYVFDPTGSPLGEVPLTLHSKAMMQPLNRTSDETGKFEFPILPPADDYVLEVNIPGFTPVKKAGITPASASVAMIPQNYIKLEGPNANTMIRLLEALEEHDDVQNVHANFDIDQKILEEVAG